MIKYMLSFFKPSKSEIDLELEINEQSLLLFNRLNLDKKQSYSFVKLINILLDRIEQLERENDER